MRALYLFINYITNQKGFEHLEKYQRDFFIFSTSLCQFKESAIELMNTKGFQRKQEKKAIEVQLKQEQKKVLLQDKALENQRYQFYLNILNKKIETARNSNDFNANIVNLNVLLRAIQSQNNDQFPKTIITKDDLINFGNTVQGVGNFSFDADAGNFEVPQ